MNCTGNQDLVTGDFDFTCAWPALMDAFNEFWLLIGFSVAIALMVVVMIELWTRP